jgi:hypothetical protein
MTFDDEIDSQPNEQPNDDERRRKLLSLIVGSAIKPFRRCAANGAPEPAAPPSVGDFGRPPILGSRDDAPAWSENIPGIGPAIGAAGRPRIPAPRTVPVTPPTFPSPDAPPSILGSASARPIRPSGPPQREDFQAKPEL